MTGYQEYVCTRTRVKFFAEKKSPLLLHQFPKKHDFIGTTLAKTYRETLCSLPEIKGRSRVPVGGIPKGSLKCY